MVDLEEPFRGSAAIAAGLVSRRSLHRNYRAIYRDVYVPRDQELTPAVKAKAAWAWSDKTATVAGLSAAALLGCRWIDDRHPAELMRRNGKPVNGILIHRDELDPDEICDVGGIAVTTAARTAFDLGRRGNLEEAVILLDALGNATGLSDADVRAVVDRRRGARGIVQLRQALDLTDPGAESPQESRTRLLIVRSGLPIPTTQIKVLDEFGHLIARLDMGWPQWRVAVEFDGAQHWLDPAQRTRDINRFAELEECGWRIIRVNSQLLRNAPGLVVERAVTALGAAGCRIEWPVRARFSLKHVS
ncbi:endonuclease domain-containing protein [Mycolicibacterium rhodesiae]|uniref:DUF559 domain-containing protein n=1 Tax=Mycolicibacterium rhodesiae TaxID=36814 RepID=A0A1X0IN51_MYCRH|nr:DUF559 domain-containing protein [Mycolicibacterium rhodesiae]MCV7347367.1 DUF559 domain-containing protein [Mycolicibacterium rhodesiae]ORB49668.1 hypothetical protein BST42_22295 [Mycolicibacterium rhodesiae]